MTATSSAPRHFRVHARHEDGHHGRLVTEPSFEAAAIAYVEHLPLPADHPEEVGVVVHEVATGHEHSFTIRLESREATPAVEP